MQQANGVQNSTSSQRGGSNKNVGILPGQSKRNTSGALRNVINDLSRVARQIVLKQTEKDHSLKGGIKINSKTPELLDTIEDLQNIKTTRLLYEVGYLISMIFIT